MAYDPDRRRLVLFGGAAMDGPERLDDLWEYDGAAGTWTARPRGQAPWPPSLYGHQMVYDPGRRRMVIPGGATTFGHVSETWELAADTGAWALRAATGTRPMNVSAYALAFDAGRAKVVMFGGWNNDAGSSSADLWEWDGASGTWTPRRRPDGAPWPAPRSNAVLAYDPARAGIVMFGGIDNQGRCFDDTWLLQDGRWTSLPRPATAPTGRSNHAMAFETGTARGYVFGGACQGMPIDELWTWSTGGNQWQRVARAPGAPWPAARASFTFVFDEARGRAVLFGGMTLVPDGAQNARQLWEYVVR
jgi:hypothetical protein